ncbi:gamma-D-glutamyl-{L}-meso-diaminopimelate peptidase I . Metallo peptidase. MEROPS family M14C [Hathewaya proteolytica DSM 3090]|uniref:Gamma-D-glutamyl-(L)-meso-diaminopimelate peptidase I. Metallo peptidase. MEROPS family M14C n=1 Tax=Hathewaya proteolytica DSM 3090 TaxID=1121331 RepID=A0A1M6KDJ0_9CLOT|nr:M14 family metallopeptidase [Hathewaya proteolytica]SHJ57009.1 gamma-D-glutamyl-{L}-meso-diaminopimelate peptidase I . Metallo peptidase. MEROPS family M14C [Hathewaya proteolytica DSM 3090]
MIILKENDRGNKVSKLQSILRQLKFYKEPVDGIFGAKTKEAVINFQKSNGLLDTGIVDDLTMDAIDRYRNGYFIYSVEKGDTLSGIGEKYGVSLQQLVMINKLEDDSILTIGQELIIPYPGINIVPTDVKYDYEVLERNIKSLKVLYPFLQVGTIGESVLGKKMYYLRLGTGEKEVGYNGAHHAIEWITSTFLMKFIEEFSKVYSKKQEFFGYSPEKIWNEASMYIVPMVNPDGVDLVINGVEESNPYYDKLIKWNKGSKDFSTTWSANIRGVDLNHNYDASFEESKKAEESYGVFGPGPTRYGGPYPQSEPESNNLVNFTREHDFRLVLAYHSQGEVIYWQYLDEAPQEALPIGETFAKISGYSLSETTGITSFAGYKDWFIKEFNRPGYTVEVGLGKNPLPLSQICEIYRDNAGVLMEAAIITE